MQGHELYKVPEFYDYLKHLTTLSTGAIVILVSMAGKFAKAARLKFIFAVGLMAFFAAVISSVVCMLFVLSARRWEGQTPDWETAIIGLSLILTASFMLIGLLSLTVFGIANFWKSKGD